MKNKILIISVIFLLSLLGSQAVLAADPQDMTVDVGVVTPGNVDLNVDINAGGGVNVVVDGTNMQQIAADVNSRKNQDTLGDWKLFLKLSGFGQWVEGNISDLQNVTNVVLNAQAKLIEDNKAVNAKIDAANGGLSADIQNMDESIKTLTNEILALQKFDVASSASIRDDDRRINSLQVGLDTQNMNLGFLQLKISEQASLIESMQRNIGYCLTGLVALFVLFVGGFILLFVRSRSSR